MRDIENKARISLILKLLESEGILTTEQRQMIEQNDDPQDLINESKTAGRPDFASVGPPDHSNGKGPKKNE